MLFFMEEIERSFGRTQTPSCRISLGDFQRLAINGDPEGSLKNRRFPIEGGKEEEMSTRGDAAGN